MSSDAIETVIAANQRFYDAFEHRDIAGMEHAWERSDRIVCIHPGWPILRGWGEVMASWHRILAGPGRNQFILTNVSVDIAGDLAWVTLDENLVGESSTRTIAATNLFLRAGDAWQLIHHQGSLVVE